MSPDFFGGFEVGDIATLVGEGVVDERGGLDMASRSSSSPTSSTSTSTSSSSTSTSISVSRRSDGGESGQGE